MSKRDPKRLPHDFHLWTAVAATIDPLRRKRLLKMANGPLPLPEPAAEKPPAPPPPEKPRRRFQVPSYQAPMPPHGKIPDRALEPSIKKKVVRGRIEIDGTIDLHGLRQDEARAALYRFIQARAARGDRTILVITGKGIKTIDDYTLAMTERGVLRTMLPVWLSEPSLSPLVSGWTVAARGHGGEGAWYVRLRRP
ncbi:MAG: mismatch repair protein MutS [Devosia sp.]|uniref:Smr/MutS family protein n=1 Tax=Devosia sp. TaxID=1871048 RepID=UPI00262C48DB|nr:Smr/MutS family protein [Devosia sp.]MDB5535225.1 mismatch repair protein MutS [Devosia sp.]MDB5586864.1 mismatch repair protein MutS [Devosia sp.]